MPQTTAQSAHARKFVNTRHEQSKHKPPTYPKGQKRSGRSRSELTESNGGGMICAQMMAAAGESPGKKRAGDSGPPDRWCPVNPTGSDISRCMKFYGGWGDRAGRRARDLAKGQTQCSSSSSSSSRRLAGRRAVMAGRLLFNSQHRPALCPGEGRSGGNYLLVSGSLGAVVKERANEGASESSKTKPSVCGRRAEGGPSAPVHPSSPPRHDGLGSGNGCARAEDHVVSMIVGQRVCECLLIA
ncbi:hypothetical protein BKA80DRAFT_65612 [Phyllosticta citrichinensis]